MRPGLTSEATAPRSTTLTSPLDAGRVRGVAYAAGPAVVFLLTFTYLFAPEFYLTWVIEEQGREYQIVEILTFSAALSAGLLLALWISRTHARGDRRVGIVVVVVVALASFFFAGEEISWGQTYLGWETPDRYRDLAAETNLHNTFLPVHALGSAFLIVIFLVLPFVWWLGGRFGWRLPAGLGCAVAEGPVVVCVAIGYVWQESKYLYRALHADYAQRVTYIEFFGQINEHTELLFAVALLLYAVFRFRHRPTM